MVNIISKSTILSAKNSITKDSGLQAGIKDLHPENIYDKFMPKDIVELSKAAKEAMEAYYENLYHSLKQSSLEVASPAQTVFDKSQSQIKAASQFTAHLAVLEKKQELFNILQG